LPTNAIILTTVGFLTSWKKLPDTVEAIVDAVRAYNVFVQIQTPWPYVGDASNEEARMREVVARAPVATRFSTDFLPESDLLDRVHASDIGFVFHGMHTSSVSAATKQFVAARCPVVVTGSTHSSDIAGGVHRVHTFDVRTFAREVLEVVRHEEMQSRLRQEMEGEYARINMDSVASKYVDVFLGI
jgi:hypothetical protein